MESWLIENWLVTAVIAVLAFLSWAGTNSETEKKARSTIGTTDKNAIELIISQLHTSGVFLAITVYLTVLAIVGLIKS